MHDRFDPAEEELRDCRRDMPDAAMVRLPAWFEAETAGPVRLGGWVRASCADGAWELEIVNLDRLERACVYVGRRRPVVLRLGEAPYRLRMAALDEAASGLILQRLSVLDRLGFLAAKVMKVVKSGRLLELFRAYMTTQRNGAEAAVTGYTASGEGPGIVGGGIVDGGALAAALDYVEVAPVPAEWPGVSIIIPSRDNIAMLAPCVESLRRTGYDDFEVILVDNGSRESETLAGLDALCAADARIRIETQDIPFNFSALCNRGVAISSKPLVLLLNDDTEARDPAWLKTMVATLLSPGVGVVGPRLVYPSGDLQHAGVATHLVPGPGHPWRGLSPAQWPHYPHLKRVHAVDAVTGACLLVRRADYQAAGGLDETHFPITLNDVDLCLKIRRSGKKIAYAGTVELVHKEGQSRADDADPSQLERRRRELAAFYAAYPVFATYSCFYPALLRRDTDRAIAVL